MIKERDPEGCLTLQSPSRHVRVFWNCKGKCSIHVTSSETDPESMFGDDFDDVVSLQPQELLAVAAELVRLAKSRHAEELGEYKRARGA